MFVAMMGIGIVLGGVRHRLVVMPVAVPGPLGDGRCMLMPMVCVVFVLVFVIHRFVRMGVHVMLGQVQPHACRHEKSRRNQSPCNVLVKDQHG